MSGKNVTFVVLHLLNEEISDVKCIEMWQSAKKSIRREMKSSSSMTYRQTKKAD